MPVPDLSNVTIPGGIKLFFDFGAGLTDLGQIPAESVKVTPKTDELKYYSSRSGKRRLAKVFAIGEEVAIDFILNEPVAVHLARFFKGGAITPVTPGTGTVTNQPIKLDGEIFHPVGQYGISAVTLKNSLGSTMVLNSDYSVDPGEADADGLLEGRIARLDGGDIEDGEQCTVSFTYSTWASLTFPVAAAAYLEGAARLEFHPSTGLQGNYHVPKCALKPNGSLAMDDKKVFDVPMTLEVLDDYDNHPTYPFGYWEALSE